MNDPDQTGPFEPDGRGLPNDDAADALPHQIGRYHVEKILGKGGFGIVYLAHDGKLLRPVAIKVPHRNRVASVKDAEAYLTEARTVANLDHPHIVPVYDVGSTEQFPCYVVSKLIEGQTLSSRIARNRPSANESTELIATVAEALHYAHRKGLVHRDIKPGNILLDSFGKPFVVDFGLALREENIGLGPKYAGTPTYMSPEQARGEGHRVDGRSDIFSLGVVFYELLTGRPPFRADTQNELLEQIAKYEPRPPRQIDDGIPKELERICLKALSKRATDRYTTATDFAEDLHHFLDTPQARTTPKNWAEATPIAAKGNLSSHLGLSDQSNQRVKIARSTFVFADFKGFTERVRILEKAAGHQAAAEMKHKVAQYVEDAFRQLEAEIKPTDYQLIDTAGDGFFFHFRRSQDAYRFAEVLQRITNAHNSNVTEEIAEHQFRTGAATGDVAWDDGKPVGHVVNVGSRLQSASAGGDFVIDQSTYDDLPPDMQKQFGPKEVIRDKNDKTYEVYRTAFGRSLSPIPVSVPTPQTTLPFNTTPASDSQPIRIVPKGLRSFDAHDADFFLKLLPGPRDRDGLPDSIRFWKTKIEERDADVTFPVGLIYGPSGCGKSSLVKAGLLPRLSADVIAVYVEATAEDTESRLLNGLRKRCPDLPADWNLKDSLALLRQGMGIPVGKKVVIVLDQFEQWLHAKKDDQNTELVQALRQCDGGRVQCVVMVRDDFWLAVSRFLRDLEIRLVEGQNSALADLFDPDHARKVLAAFGQAFGKLPESHRELGKEQKEFLTQAVAGLAQDGKVISVRIALFAEMMKGKVWTPSSLKEVGGTAGVGVTFLEETFSATTAPPEHRYHQRAARGVLKALLPESGTDIKGHMRLYEELIDASGYANRPKDFDDLIHILDGEIRLITPTDPEGRDDGEPVGVSHRHAGVRYFQLTHDYLVPSIRDWLTRKQRETRRGRAELRLAGLSAQWNAFPAKRQLPTWLEWMSIRVLTAQKNWTPPQRKMMTTAGRVHALRGAALGVLLAVAALAGLAIRDRVEQKRKVTQAEGLVRAVLNAETVQVPGIIESLAEFRPWAEPLLREELAKAAANSKPKLHASLALLPGDATEVDFLSRQLLDAVPADVQVIRIALDPHKDSLIEKLWAIALKPENGKETQRLRAAAALALYDPEGENWAKMTPAVGDDLVNVPAVYLANWIESLRPVKDRLIPPLAAIFRDPARREVERSLATDTLADYAADRPPVLADLLMDADEKQFAVIFPKFKQQGDKGLPVLLAEIAKTLPKDLPSSDDRREALAKRQANAAVALLRLNKPETVWPLLKHSPDPRVRSYLIHKLNPLGADAAELDKRLEVEKDITIRRALLLSLGEFADTTFAPDDLKKLREKVQTMYRNEPDAGLHAAAEWLLRTWKQHAWLKQVNDEWANDKNQREKRLKEIGTSLTKDNEKALRPWYVNTQGQTYVVLPGPVEFTMGSPKAEKDHNDSEVQHQRKIGRSFAISSKSLTLGQYRHLTKDKYEIGEKYTHSPDLPVVGISWYMAAKYCNLLSKEEGIPEGQWCYEIKGQHPDYVGSRFKENYLSLTGYRLPTEAEMEFATRADATTSRYFGETEALLGQYAWYTKNTGGVLQQVGGKKPNDFGLFDSQGNCFTWCQDEHNDYPEAVGEKAIEDKEVPKEQFVIISTGGRLLRGGSFIYNASNVRSSNRVTNVPTARRNDNGFRPARTFTP